jgi:hypothetical protein
MTLQKHFRSQKWQSMRTNLTAGPRTVDLHCSYLLQLNELWFEGWLLSWQTAIWYVRNAGTQSAKGVFADGSVRNRQLFLLFRWWILCRWSKNLKSSSVNSSNWDKSEREINLNPPPPSKGGEGQVVIFLDGPCVSVNKPPRKYTVKAETILLWCRDKTLAQPAGQVENAKRKKSTRFTTYLTRQSPGS